jgi:TonB family protein
VTLVVAVAIAWLALSASHVHPADAPLGPGQAALLIAGAVGAPEVAAWTELAGDSRPLARATAARLAAVSGTRSLAPALLAALEKETDAVAAHEQMRALAIISGPEADEALFRTAARFDGALDASLARSVSLRGAPALALVPRLAHLELTEGDWYTVEAWITANAVAPLGPIASVVLSTDNEIAWAALLSLATRERKPLEDDALARALAKSNEPTRERTYWHLLSLDHGTPAEGSPLARALAETPEARGEGGPVARLGYELVGRQFGRSARSQTDLIAALDPLTQPRLPSDARALRRLRGDEVQAYGRVRFKDKDALAGMLKVIGRGKAEPSGSSTPVTVMRTLSDLVPGLSEEILAAAGCSMKGSPWALLEIRYDAAGRREGLGSAIPPEIGPECQRAARALLLTAMVPPRMPARPKETDALLLPLYTSFFECVGRGRPSKSSPAHIGGAITEPHKTRNVNPIYPRKAIDERVQGVVILEATISSEGCISAAEVLRSVDPRLDAAAVQAVTQWEYTPTRLDGVPVPVLMTVTVNFRLN